MRISKDCAKIGRRGFRQFQVSIGAVEMLENSGAQLYADYPLYCLNPLSANALKNWGFADIPFPRGRQRQYADVIG